MMDRVPEWIVFLLFLILLTMVNSETEEAKGGLVQFMNKISTGNAARNNDSWGWNLTSDPCNDSWKGVDCLNSSSVKKIVLNSLNLTGIFDADSLCLARSLQVISLNDNKVTGKLPEEISNCSRLTHLYIQRNNFSGNLPFSLPKLSNLKRVAISNNNFSGILPDLSRISGLLTFLAENNHLSGRLPKFDFSNLREFNVSNNNFSGPIPDLDGHFTKTSFLGNPGLCGEPLSNPCIPSPSPISPPKKNDSSKKQYFIYSGYAAVGLIAVLLVIFKVTKSRKPKGTSKKSDVKSDSTSSKPSSMSSEFKNRSEYSITSPDDHTKASSSSLVVLSSPVVNGLKFEDLLRAPAELIGRGKNGSLYRVSLNSEVNLAVKRIKDWEISRDEFKKRMQKIDQVKHQNVLPVVAYYCSQQEKLLVYEFQQNGSLFKLLHGSQNGEMFDWGSRLNVAAMTANALALMHQELKNDAIPHGNLKSSNIMLNKEMDPCISEYGLMEAENQDQLTFLPTNTTTTSTSAESNNDSNTFKSDIYSFGVILLELLTGKLVHNRSSDLARWVHSVVREEWTAEVFDKALISEGVSEERMVNLLQVALRCINPNQYARPNMSQVAEIILSIKEEDEKSLIISAEL